jgi:ectoine hydroxylase-related dioxygenase (phytanoyl-CoA dioxygenase family)
MTTAMNTPNTTTPPATVHPGVPDEIGPELLDEFLAHGYLAFENVLSTQQVEDAKSAITELVHACTTDRDRAEIHVPRDENGRVGQASLKSRQSRFFVQLEKGFEPDPAKPEEVEMKVRKLMWFEEEHAALRHLAFEQGNIQKILSALIGDGSKLFQSMALIKPARIGTEKPWHQDNAYFKVAPLDAIVGVWIALDPATIANGCMHVLEGGHRLGALKHYHTIDCEIEDGRIEKTAAKPVELQPGGAVFFYGMLPHQTPPNQSPERRRALQYHYHGADARQLSSADYDALFAEPDGTPASCEAARNAGV